MRIHLGVKARMAEIFNEVAVSLEQSILISAIIVISTPEMLISLINK